MIKSETFRFRVTLLEKKLLEDAAAVAGLNPSVWSREVLLGVAGVALAAGDIQDDETVTVSLNSTGRVVRTDRGAR